MTRKNYCAYKLIKIKRPNVSSILFQTYTHDMMLITFKVLTLDSKKL